MEYWGACADVLRLVILKKYGGIYLDVDNYLKKYDLAINYNFAFLSQSHDIHDTAGQIENSLIGASKQNPIVTRLLNSQIEITLLET